MVSSPAFQRRPLDRCSSSRTLLPGFWLEPENLSISHQSSGPYTGFQLHLGLIFKVLLLVYKSLNGLGPKYIADMLTEYKPNRPLRSLGSSQLEIPRVHTKQGESAFSYYAARSWNQLPEEIRCAKTLLHNTMPTRCTHYKTFSEEVFPTISENTFSHINSREKLQRLQATSSRMDDLLALQLVCVVILSERRNHDKREYGRNIYRLFDEAEVP